jgi:YqxM protein
MRNTRLRRFRNRHKKLLITFQVFCIWYCTLFTANYLTTTTRAYFNDIEVIENRIHVKWDEVWDKSSLKFIGSVGFNCTVGFQSLIKNGGDEDMQGPSTYILYYKETGSPNKNDPGIEIARGSIPALNSGDSINLTYLPEVKPSPGTYKFMAFQRPGHNGEGELWGDEINVSNNQINACEQWKSVTSNKQNSNKDSSEITTTNENQDEHKNSQESGGNKSTRDSNSESTVEDTVVNPIELIVEKNEESQTNNNEDSEKLEGE